MSLHQQVAVLVAVVLVIVTVMARTALARALPLLLLLGVSRGVIISAGSICRVFLLVLLAHSAASWALYGMCIHMYKYATFLLISLLLPFLPHFT